MFKICNLPTPPKHPISIIKHVKMTNEYGQKKGLTRLYNISFSYFDFLPIKQYDIMGWGGTYKTYTQPLLCIVEQLVVKNK